MWDGISPVPNVVDPTLPVTVVLPTDPELVVLLIEVDVVVDVVVDTLPDGVWLANAVVNATVPPELAVPLTTRNALLSCAVDLVHPVGAAVWAKIITLPAGMGELADVKTLLPPD